MLLEPPLSQIIPNDFIVVLIQTLISTAVIILFSEYLPKVIGSTHPRFYHEVILDPLIHRIYSPLSYHLNHLLGERVYFGFLGIKNEKGTVQPLSPR